MDENYRERRNLSKLKKKWDEFHAIAEEEDSFSSKRSDTEEK